MLMVNKSKTTPVRLMVVPIILLRIVVKSRAMPLPLTKWVIGTTLVKMVKHLLVNKLLTTSHSTSTLMGFKPRMPLSFLMAIPIISKKTVVNWLAIVIGLMTKATGTTAIKMVAS